MTHHSVRSAPIARIRCAQGAAGEPAWAHVSGWAQLSGNPRKVSCVVPCGNAAQSLSRLLPELSDFLTEAGFPWEIMCVDSASTDGTAELLSQWSEFPGFTWIRLVRDFGETVATQTGMHHARGDAVILVGAMDNLSIELLPEMIEKWDEGNEIVLLRRAEGATPPRLVCWSLDGPGLANGVDDESAVVGPDHLVLLDRRVVDLLLETAGG
jgi:glycosyltransferase involved in cell wall biosynthesis